MFYKKKLFVATICLLVLLALPLLYISLKKNGGGATTRSSEKIELVPHKNFEATLLSYTPIIKVNKDFENAPFNINNYDTAVLTLIYSNYSQQDYKNIQATLHVEQDLPHQINFDHHDPTTFIPTEVVSSKDTKFYLGGLKKGELRENGFSFRAGAPAVVTIYAVIVADDNMPIKTDKITVTVTK